MVESERYPGAPKLIVPMKSAVFPSPMPADAAVKSPVACGSVKLRSSSGTSVK